MKFKVLISYPNEMECGDGVCEHINDAIRQLPRIDSWEKDEVVRQSIREWANNAKAGDVYFARKSAIVAVSPTPLSCERDECPNCLHTVLEFSSLTVKDDDVLQQVECLECGNSWTDVLSLTKRISHT